MNKVLLLATLFFYGLNFSFAQSGQLDPSFGTNGIVTTDLGSSYNLDYKANGQQVLIDSDGRIYIIVQAILPTYQVYVTRRLPDGAPDLSYGNKGYSDLIKMINPLAALQPDGKIVLAGYNDATIARINEKGRLDSSFDGDGKMVIDYAPTALAIQSDGKIIVTGKTQYTFPIVRYNSNGSIDNSFTAEGLPLQFPTGLAIQSDGKIIVIGSITKTEYDRDFAIARYNTNGSLDSEFSNDGKDYTDFDSSVDQANTVTVQSDGKILLTGYTGGGLGFVRYNEDGSPDNSFGNKGKQKNVSLIIPTSTTIQSDGRILVAGYGGSDEHFIIERYYANGSSDNTFGVNGHAIVDFGFPTHSYSVAIKSDGKIVATGGNESGDFFVVAQLRTDGNLDNSFDSDGKLLDRLDFNAGSTFYRAIAVQSDGKIIVAGNAWNGTSYDIVLTRYNINGSLDNTFSDDGVQRTDLGFNERATSVVIQSDAKILLAGYSEDYNHTIFVARYNADGSKDINFGNDGILYPDFTIATGVFSSSAKVGITQQTDGKIVVAGKEIGDFAIARYNLNGTPDNSFSGDGKVTTDFSSEDSLFVDGASAIAIQNDGKIVAVGSSVNDREKVGTYSYFSIARYNTDGSLDNTFSSDGKQIIKPNIFVQATAESLVINSDGKIIIGGTVQFGEASENTYLIISRLNNDGSIDATFGQEGGGSQITNIIGSAGSIALQADGKIITTISSSENNKFYGTGVFAIARFQTDGSLDNSFSGDGIEVLNKSLQGDEIESIAIFNNSLYAVGSGQYPGNLGVVARYLLDNENKTPPTVSITSPVNNATFSAPADILLKATAIDSDGTITRVEFYNGTTLLRTERYTLYSWTWKNVPVGDYIITAKAYDDDSLVTTSAPVHISVVPNTPPTVNITSPAEGGTYKTEKSIVLSADASDADGTIKMVQFYNGNQLIGTESDAPYYRRWYNVAPGNYTITAKATDNNGAVTVSAPVHITVVHNQPPVVSITSPVNGANYSAPATIIISAKASDPDGTIKKVEFYEGTTLLHTENYSRYLWYWKDVPAGTYTITAKAIDDNGRATVSAPVTITVSAQQMVRGTSSNDQLSLSKSALNVYKESLSLKLNPNPAKDILNISTEGFKTDSRSAISIISVSGSLVKTIQTNALNKNLQLNVSSLKPGSYFIKVINANKILYKQFIKL